MKEKQQRVMRVVENRKKLGPILSCCWDKIPNQNNLREKGFIWLLIQGQSLSWQRNHGGRGSKLVTPSQEQKAMNVCAG